MDRAADFICGSVGTAASKDLGNLADTLAALAIRGALVTIDAMGCQTMIAQTIVDRPAADLLAVKDNWPAPLPLQEWRDAADHTHRSKSRHASPSGS